MLESLSAVGEHEQVLAEFLIEWQNASDGDAVLSSYCARFPDIADELHSLAEIENCFHAASPPAEPLPPRRLNPGQQLGEFVIVRLIAVGGMGEVYEAKQNRLKRSVALKVIRRGRIQRAARIRFVREQETLARLHQTHIVPIHTAGVAGDEDEIQYFAMAYIDGAPLNRVVDTAYGLETSSRGQRTPSLRELADSAPPVPASDTPTAEPTVSEPIDATLKDPVRQLTLSPTYFRSVAEVMAQAADAIQHAHDVGIYHRDVKPSNLMVDRTGHCWIIDFGLAGCLSPQVESPAPNHCFLPLPTALRGERAG